MALTFPERPDDCHVERVCPIATGGGELCQIQAIVVYMKRGLEVGRKPLVIEPGLLAQYDVEPEKMAQLWDAIPSVPQSVKDAIRTQLPDQVFIDLWKG